jgi:uridine phosphorylase
MAGTLADGGRDVSDSFPNQPRKYSDEALFEPRAYMEYLQSVGRGPGVPKPQGAVLCYETALIRRLRQTHGIAAVAGAMSDYLYVLPDRSELVVAGGFGIGAPIAAAVMEELIALGCRRFVSIGTAGCLRPDLAIGTLVVCDRAVRDEGTSHHYVPSSLWAWPSTELTGAVEAALRRQGVQPHIGGAWTIDALYRETAAEVRHYRSLDVAVVEMEAAALFAVAAYRGAQAAAVFTVSDSLADLVWRPEFHREEVGDALEAMFAAACEALSPAPPGAGDEPVGG